MVTASRRAWTCLRNAPDALRFRGDSTFRPPSFFGGHPPRFLCRREQTQVSRSQFQSQLFPPSQLFFRWQEQLQDLNARPPAGQISAEDGRRLLRLVRLEAVKNRLQRIHDDCISFDELLRVCMESVEGSSEEEARGIAKLLDESGHVLVFNNTVYLYPYKIARAFEKVIPTPMAAKSDPCEELERLEKEKVEIDQKAESRARTELRLGLGFFGLQTAGLMRLTFWELSWDVMEPVCFFLTSIYFMAGYLFFLNTSTNPSFESFFNTRFSARRSRLMKKRNFDIKRFRELRRLSRPGLKPSSCCRGVCNCDDL